MTCLPLQVCDIDHSNCHWCNGPDCRTGLSCLNNSRKCHVISCQIPIFVQTGCHSDANCPMERPICGAGASDSSGSSLEGSGSDHDDNEGSGDESHRCGCSSDSDCFQLEATLPDNLTAICEDNVCVEGCRCHVFTILTAGIEFDLDSQKQSEKLIFPGQTQLAWAGTSSAWTQA